MNALTAVPLSLICVMGIAVARADDVSTSEIMKSLELDAGGKTEVVKDFPDSFPEALTARGKHANRVHRLPHPN